MNLLQFWFVQHFFNLYYRSASSWQVFEDKHEKLQATRPLCQQTNQSLGCFWCRTFFGSDFIQFHYSQHPPGTTASMCWYGTLFFIAWRPGSITCKKKNKKTLPPSCKRLILHKGQDRTYVYWMYIGLVHPKLMVDSVSARCSKDLWIHKPKTSPLHHRASHLT